MPVDLPSTLLFLGRLLLGGVFLFAGLRNIQNAAFLIQLMAARGYHVTALTGKDAEHDFLRALGATDVLSRNGLQMGTKPLEKPLWAGAVDVVGGETLAWLTRTMIYGGCIASSGLTGGTDLHTTVLPFILRGVKLLGIDSVMCPMATRLQVWQRLASDLKPEEISPWARETLEHRREDLGKDGMQVRCLPLGPAYATSGDSTGSEMMRIVQTPQLIVMLNPDLTYRQIFLDGRALESEPNPSFMGYSVGHWDHDTLVVESAGYSDRTWLDHDGHPHSEALRMTERYHRRDVGHLDIEVTLSDPQAYARPWTVAVRAELLPDTEMIEFVCNENERSLEHWVGKASDEQKKEVQVAPGVLAKYVGTYAEQAPFWRTYLLPSEGASARPTGLTATHCEVFGSWK